MKRVNELVSIFQELYHGVKSVETREISTNALQVRDIIELILAEKFVYTDVTEEQLFVAQTDDDLLFCAQELYREFKGNQQPFQKIILTLLLYRLYSFHLPNRREFISLGTVPYTVIQSIENQNYEAALQEVDQHITSGGLLSEPMLKGIGMVFYGLGFQLIERQVQKCIQKEKPHLFNSFSFIDYPCHVPRTFAQRYEIIQMPVRVELTSSVGSDIFFLSMTRPEKARCINISVNLFDEQLSKFAPPIQILTRPIHEYGIRITSHDLKCSKLITSFTDLFNMRNDDLSLLKAAIVASGIVPPSIQRNSTISFEAILKALLRDLEAYSGFELITKVVDIPRGSGLAVSTNLLAGMILSLMRFSGQMPTGKISEEQKMDVAIRAIYGEWLGGNGGGWQDYGGLWGGFKEITGQKTSEIDENQSNGKLLPRYEEMKLSEEVVEHVLESMILVNGGTGQNVGPILKMITTQFITKDETAWKARLNTEDKYEAIRNALFNGNVRQLGNLERQDFVNRVKISPLANNYYHEQALNKLEDQFAENLWGYDSTGGRAGAGGVFWVDPKYRGEFEETFLRVCTELQTKLFGQMYFASPPLVYSFQLNRSGVSLKKISKKEGEEIIASWKPEDNQNERKGANQYQVEQVKNFFGYSQEYTERLIKEYKRGNLSLKQNISPVLNEKHHCGQGDWLLSMASPESDSYKNLFREGELLLKDYPIAYITLNGGESTRYGANVIRSINPSIYLEGKYYSPVELKMRHLRFTQQKYNTPIYPVFVNGYFTEKNTLRFIKDQDYFGFQKESVFHCRHEVTHRVVPTKKDLIFWYENSREKAPSKKEEELAFQYHTAMLEWIDTQGESSIYKPVGVNKLNTLVSPGHYFSFMSIVMQGLLGKLIQRGVRSIIVSSNDNLMSTIDPAILAIHVLNHHSVTAEVVPKLFDRGGAPIQVGEQVRIFEDFQFPSMESLWKVPYFNPITSWIQIDALLEALQLTKEDMVEAAEGSSEAKRKCRQAVYHLAGHLQTYPVLKHLNEDMGGGILYSFPVVQFEKLYGDFISRLNPNFLLVPKLMRHTQIKSIDHIYQLYNDHSLDILNYQLLRKNYFEQAKREEIWD